jgi:hypothetical protein
LPAPQCDTPLAVAVGVDPADRARVPLTVHALKLADNLDGGIRRRASDGGRRVNGGDECERGPLGRQGAVHPRPEVLDVGQADQLGARGDVHGRAERRQGVSQ